MAGLRDRHGRPALRTRVMAVAVLVGLLALTAPVVVPVLRWLVALLTP